MGTLPLIGALPSFVRDPFGTLRRAAATSGVCRLDLGVLDMVTLHEPDHVDHVLRKHAAIYRKEGPFWESIRALLGNGLVTSTGALWLRQRRMLQPQFHRRRLAAMADSIIDALEDSLDWDDVGLEAREIDVGGRMPRLTMNVVSSVLLGAPTTGEVATEVFAELRFSIDHMFRAILADRLPRWVPLPGREHFHRSSRRLRSLVGRFVEERRRRGGEHDDILGLMLEVRDEETGQGMSDEQILDEAMSLFLAGFETTANGLQWALSFLAKHPECFARLRDETDALLGSGRPTFADLPRLTYARWVMQEALRINPPSWWLPRALSEDDEIDGYRIKAGTLVTPIPYTIHRHPDHWRDPERFDPERFSPERSAKRHRFAWVPFGAGPHQCVGKELALMEATLALTLFAQRYELRSSGHEVRPKLSTVVVPHQTVRALVRRRPSRPRVRTPMRSESSSSLSL